MINYRNSGNIFKIGLLLLGIVVIFSFAVNTTAAANMSNIYVSTHGNDSWNGLNPIWISGKNGPKATINNATGIVKSGGTVHIAHGTYKENNISLSYNMKIIGENQKNTIINGNNNGQIFSISLGADVNIINLTLTNGKMRTFGGAIRNDGNLTVNNCTFTHNTATIDPQFNIGGGGAIFNYASTLTVYKSTFTNNGAPQGGAIYDDMANTVIHFSRLVGNTATQGGNAIYNSEFGTVNATLNWWGYNSETKIANQLLNIGPINYNPWIVLSINANPTKINIGGHSTITADLIHDNKGKYHNPINGLVPYNGPANFKTTKGIIKNSVFSNEIAKSTLTNLLTAELITVSATVDNQTVSTKVITGTPPHISSTNPANNAVEVATNKIIHINFNQSIKLGTHPWIEFYSTGTRTPKPFKLTITGSTLNITPKTLLAKETKYTITIHSNSVTDLTGIGLEAPYTIRFTTA